MSVPFRSPHIQYVLCPPSRTSLCSQYCSLIPSHPNLVIFNPSSWRYYFHLQNGNVPAWERSTIRVMCLRSTCLRKGNGHDDLASVPRCQKPPSSEHQSLTGCLLQTPRRRAVSAEREREKLLKVAFRLNLPSSLRGKYLSQCTTTRKQEAGSTCLPHLSASV